MLLLNVRKKFVQTSLKWSQPEHKRLLVPALLLVLLAQNDTREIVITVLADAFWQVSVFVAATLAIYHLLANKLSSSELVKRLNKSSNGQVVFASILGAIPGCGGAIIVITQYVSGSMSFGSVVAVLTATMGDAAFLLLASEPLTGISVTMCTMTVGVLSGAIVDKLHHKDFLRPKVNKQVKSLCCDTKDLQVPNVLKAQGSIWRVLVVPAAIISLLYAAQLEINQVLKGADEVLSIIGAVLALAFIVLWASSTKVSNFETVVAEDKKAENSRIFQKVALDTNFVTSWAVMAFIAFELVMYFGQFDIKQLFSFMPAIAPLAGVLIGVIPGCGPQIITTSLYLTGAIPLSAQLGNAISNDGDALFPAIALSPKVAIWATLYSTIPALIVAYGYYWLLE